jgi:AcrR family transcriptional regulator
MAPTRREPQAPAGAERRGEHTRERILDAAEALFADRGFEGTALRDVAGRVGIRTPSLYNHFPSKEALYAAVLERVVAPVLSLLSAMVESPPAERPTSREVVERVMALLAVRPDLPRLVVHEALGGGQHLRPLLQKAVGPVLVRAQEAVLGTPAAERWGSDRVPLLVLAAYHMVVGHFAIAPFYREISGQDLLEPAALDQQTRFLADVIDLLLSAPEAPPEAEGGPR